MKLQAVRGETVAIRDFNVGQRVRLHPATDLFMRGVVYADVVKVGRKLVTVEWQRGPLKSRFKVHPRNLEAL